MLLSPTHTDSQTDRETDEQLRDQANVPEVTHRKPDGGYRGVQGTMLSTFLRILEVPLKNEMGEKLIKK